jgi:hypothetical protein
MDALDFFSRATVLLAFLGPPITGVAAGLWMSLVVYRRSRDLSRQGHAGVRKLWPPAVLIGILWIGITAAVSWYGTATAYGYAYGWAHLDRELSATGDILPLFALALVALLLMSALAFGFCRFLLRRLNPATGHLAPSPGNP